MPPSSEDILRICEAVAQHEHLKAAFKGLLMSGAGAALGSFLGGPIGTFLGGTIGSQVGGTSFISVVSVIKNMTSSQKQQLAERVARSLKNIGPQSLILLLPMILGTGSLKTAVLKEIINFITNEMGMAVEK